MRSAFRHCSLHLEDRKVLRRITTLKPPDYHIHTRHSFDCQHTMQQMCQAAIDAGISEIGVSDHVDWHPENPGHHYFEADAWWEDYHTCRTEFKNQLTIRAGLELGEPNLYPRETENLLALYPWDYCLASVHRAAERMICDPAVFHSSEEYVYDTYFDSVLAMVEHAHFDILGHLDIIKRYSFGRYQPFDPRNFEEIIRQILKTLVARKKVLEVNTGTLRKAVQQISPHPLIIDWFFEEGGTWVTIGSDAHKPQGLGTEFDLAVDVIRSAGFDTLAQFEKRCPSPLQLHANPST
jgi:histidinol-phosphatase (PHP family)